MVSSHIDMCCVCVCVCRYGSKLTVVVFIVIHCQRKYALAIAKTLTQSRHAYTGATVHHFAIVCANSVKSWCYHLIDMCSFPFHCRVALSLSRSLPLSISLLHVMFVLWFALILEGGGGIWFVPRCHYYIHPHLILFYTSTVISTSEPLSPPAGHIVCDNFFWSWYLPLLCHCRWMAPVYNNTIKPIELNYQWREK